MTTTNLKQLAILKARSFFANNNDLDWSVCMQLGWAVAKAMRSLSVGCTLTFTKVETGEIATRKAVAVTSSNYNFKGSDKATNPYQVKFFDVEKRGIRSFNIQKLVKID